MKVYIIVLLLAITQSSIAQSTYEPKIVILNPNNVIIDDSLSEEVQKLNNSIKEALKNVDWDERKKLIEDNYKNESENVKKMENKKIAFMKKADYFSNLSTISELFLQYKLFPQFENLMIYAVPDRLTSSDAKNMLIISEKYKSQYVLNFSELELYKEGDTKKCRIEVQLYDKKQNKIIFLKTFTGDDKNPGFEFACKSGTLSCTFNNSLAAALPEIIRKIYDNTKSIQDKKSLSDIREEMLLNDFYLKPTDKMISKVIESADKSLPIKKLYQGMLNSKKTKFMSFFVSETKGMTFKELISQKEKQKVEILSDTFGEVPNTKAFLVIGVKKNDQWSIKRKRITYFNSSDIFEARKKYFSILKTLDFFKTNSIEINSNFWNTNLFNID